MVPDFNLPGLSAALGVGLLIGLERERRKGVGPGRAAAGLRTFTLVALTGALAYGLGGSLLLAALALAVGALAALAYWRSGRDDPGLTTEVALVVTFLLGALAMEAAALAVGIGVVVALLLYLRDRVHRFVREIINEHEMHDGLLLAAAALVILPLTPDRAVDPFGVLNPRTLWTLAVLMMAINAAGYVVLRAVGPRIGLPFAGFAAGFISSSATIAAMGARSRAEPALRRGAVAGAVLSSVATVVQLGVLLAATSLELLVAVRLPLLFAGAVAVGYGLLFAWHGMQGDDDGPLAPGRPFDPRLAVLFAAAIGLMLFGVALVDAWLGPRGVSLAVGLTGFADAHSSAAAVGGLVASGGLGATAGTLAVLIAFSTNSVTKVVIAFVTGDRAFAARVVPGVVAMLLAAWAAWLLGP